MTGKDTKEGVGVGEFHVKIVSHDKFRPFSWVSSGNLSQNALFFLSELERMSDQSNRFFLNSKYKAFRLSRDLNQTKLK